MKTLAADFHYALRSLTRSPAFAAVAVATLALGIGANTAIYSLVQGVLLRALPFPESGRIVSLGEWDRDERRSITVSPANFLDWQEQNRVFDAIGAWYATSLAFAEGIEPERLSVTAATPGFFRALRVAPALGRVFDAGQARHGAAPVAVLSHDLWVRRFHSDPQVVGRSVSLDGESYTVLGVMPRGFGYPEGSADLWIPADLGSNPSSQRGAHYLDVLARLRPGVSIERAAVEMTEIAAGLERRYPGTNKGYGVSVVPLRDRLVGEVGKTLWILLGAVGLVALIACVNVANLLLARATRRTTEFGLRTALGARRSRLIRQLLTESAVLALAGGALALPLAAWAIETVRRLSPDLPRLAEVSVDGGVLAFTAALSLAAVALSGLAPAWNAARLSPMAALRSGAGSDARSARIRRTLVAAEIGLALLLLSGAGLLLRSLQRLRHVDPGFRPEKVLSFEITLPAARYPDEGAVAAFTDALLSRLSALPDVRAAGATFALPLTGTSFSSSFRVAGRPVAPEDEPSAQLRVATRDYFAALGIPLKRGRLFTGEDRRGAPQAILISESAARKFFPEGDAIGQRLRFGAHPGETRIEGEVVGVVGDVHEKGLHAGPIPEFYGSLEQAPVDSFAVAIRTAGDAAAISSAAREQVRSLDPSLPVTGLRTVEEIVRRSLSRERFTMLLLAAFAALSLLLSVVGLYGVMADAVGQRTREIGIRVALGASRQRVLGQILAESARLLGAGLALGLAAALAANRVLATLLFQVAPTDPATLAGVIALLSAAGLLAAWLPARRAARLDPMAALRSE
jgi:predicted permease